MISKLTAIVALITFVVLTLAGLLLRYVLDRPFSLEAYFQYLILFVFAIILLGKPFIKLALDLVRAGYHDHEDRFRVPGAQLPPEKHETVDTPPATRKKPSGASGG